MLEEGRKLTIKSVKVTAKTLKVLTKALVSVDLCQVFRHIFLKDVIDRI